MDSEKSTGQNTDKKPEKKPRRTKKNSQTVAPQGVISPTSPAHKPVPGEILPGDPRYGREEQWGAWWRPEDNQLWRHLTCFRMGPEKITQSLGRAEHFREIVRMLWGPTNRKKRFIWHPWAERMLEASCAEMGNDKSYLGIAGGSGCGKTEFAAVWAIVQFLALPNKTTVLVTSTSLKDSRKRIWGAIKEYWMAIPGRAPGKLVDSAGLIRFDLGTKESQGSDKCGISLIAADKTKEKEAYGKMIGFHNPRIVVILDELPELGESVLGACYSNISQNPWVQIIGIGNPSSYYDPFGQFVKPKNGWASINLNSEEWDTSRGKCIRFDGEKSPNILAGRNIYPFLMTQEFLTAQKEHLGENSYGYFRMCRGMFNPTGAVDGVYAEADIIKFKADLPALWIRPPIKVAALDPAFTNGGDRSALFFGGYGESPDGLKVLSFDRVVFLSEDMNNKDVPRSFQIVRQFKEMCEKEGVLPENAAFDATGAGKPFGDIVARDWSPKVLRIEFGGKASGLPASVSDSTPGHERYANRVTEIWFGAKELMRTGQIKNVTPSLAKELCARSYTAEKGAVMRLRVEPKQDLKMRIGVSPDEADAALMLVELCRQRFGFGADRAAETGRPRGQVTPMRQLFQRLTQVSAGRRLARV